ncbi:unnamed protein product [Orchesella dallaii]|uniref:Transmembrane protein n=1 Tax=Orchesella dallaii TaxID=48710 RepID=A0ABP1Q3L7_9HEXA
MHPELPPVRSFRVMDHWNRNFMLIILVVVSLVGRAWFRSYRPDRADWVPSYMYIGIEYNFLFRKKKNYNGYLSHYMFVKRAKSESRDLFEYFLEEISKLRFDPDEEGVAIEEVEPLVFTDSESEEEIE